MPARSDHIRRNSTPLFVAQMPGLVLEFLIGLPLLIVLILLGLDRMSVAFPKTHLVGTFLEIGLFRFDVAEALAVDGRAPDARRLQPAIDRMLEVPGSAVRAVHVEEGSFHVVLDAKKALGSAAAGELESNVVTLSMILAMTPPEHRHSLVWYCGLADPGPLLSPPTIANRTDIPPAYLPPVCKL